MTIHISSYLANCSNNNIHSQLSANIHRYKWLYLNMKSSYNLRTGYPDLLILTVSIMPEYFNWFITTSGMKLLGTYMCVQ